MLLKSKTRRNASPVISSPNSSRITNSTESAQTTSSGVSVAEREHSHRDLP